MRLKTVSRSPAFEADIQLATNSRISFSSLCIVFTSLEPNVEFRQ
jgi:hypothetical protein